MIDPTMEMIDPVEMEVMERPEELVKEEEEIDPSAIYLCNLSENDDPDYADPGASGMDIRAELSKFNSDFLVNGFVTNDGVTLHPGGRALFPTGLHMALPLGLEAQVRPRSGLALKNGITVLNAPGTIDSSYRGDIGVILINQGIEDFTIRTGDRIAQLVIVPYAKVLRFAKVNKVGDLPPSERMAGGFGSTGVK